MTAYELDVPDTLIDLPPAPASNAGHGVSQCPSGCVVPVSCASCDGTRAEEREVWRDARREARERTSRARSGAEMEALWLRTLPQESRELWLAATRDGQAGAA